ncbi:MAG: DUF4199 domain-containing protein [Rikenellaceae bacterium]
MDNNIKSFFNEAAKWGLILGVMMGVSRVFEYRLMLSGSVTQYSLLTIEWVVVAVIYALLLYRAVKSRAVAIYPSVGFSFGRSVNYAVVISMFAAVIVSLASFTYINSVVGGYDLYIGQLVTSVTSVIEEAKVESAVMDMYAETFAELKNTEVATPTIFDTLLSTLSMYILAGTFFGVIVSFFVKRYIKKSFNEI